MEYRHNGVYLSRDIDQEKARAARNDYRIWAWCRQNVLLSETDQQKWVGRVADDSSIHMLSVRLEGPECQIGVCGLTSIDLLYRKAEFSLYISPEYQRKGYSETALKLLLAYGFESFNLNRIWGEVLKGNHAMKIFNKVGLETEGVLRETYFKDGAYCDSIIVGMLQRDYLRVKDRWFR